VESLCKEKSKYAGRKELVSCSYLKSTAAIGKFLVYVMLDSFCKGTGRKLMSCMCGLLSS